MMSAGTKRKSVLVFNLFSFFCCSGIVGDVVTVGDSELIPVFALV